MELCGILHLLIGLMSGKSTASFLSTEITLAATSLLGGKKLVQSESKEQTLLNNESNVAQIGAKNPDKSYIWPISRASKVFVTFIWSISSDFIDVRSQPLEIPLSLE